MWVGVNRLRENLDGRARERHDARPIPYYGLFGSIEKFFILGL